MLLQKFIDEAWSRLGSGGEQIPLGLGKDVFNGLELKRQEAYRQKTEELPGSQKQFLRQAEAEVSWDSHDWYITVFLSIVYFPTSF